MPKILSRLHRRYLYNLCAKKQLQIVLRRYDLFENAFITGILRFILCHSSSAVCDSLWSGYVRLFNVTESLQIVNLDVSRSALRCGT
jgi:hypothetical protein